MLVGTIFVMNVIDCHKVFNAVRVVSDCVDDVLLTRKLAFV